MQRLRSSGSSIWGNLVSTPRLKRKASNSWAAVQDAFFSTKDTFERNKVVFTVGTSIASVATAWIGYSLRYYHETRIDQRLETIEKAMRNSNNLEHSELREIAGSGSISAPACFATAGTTLIIGSAVGSRTKLISVKGQDDTSALAPVPNDGICTSMVETKGYVCEEHKVTTQDGYILSMQRIPEGRSGKTPGKRPPVLLQHGLMMDGITWLLLPPDQSLTFLLADNGFDVWLANTRGSKYSRGHTSLSPNEPAYWDWSWDELVAYDLPATFQYVHDKAGQKLHYVGHSLGTLIALAAFSKHQLLNVLRSTALLCPIAYMGQIVSPLAKISADNFLAEVIYWLGINEFNPRG
ncbi:hypothetical protein ACB098_06G088300 [Castanea mollissima]